MLDLTVRSYSIRPKQLDQRRTLHLRRSIDHEKRFVSFITSPFPMLGPVQTCADHYLEILFDVFTLETTVFRKYKSFILVTFE